MEYYVAAQPGNTTERRAFIARRHVFLAGTYQRIAPQHFLDLQRQRREAPSHIGVTSRQPHPHTCGNGDHGLCFLSGASQAASGRSRRSRTRFKASVSTPAPIRTSRPFRSSISMRSSRRTLPPSGRGAGPSGQAAGKLSAAGASAAGGKAKVTGTKTGTAARASASLASRRQRNSRPGVIPCRRATAETFASGRSASATILCFSASLHCRRTSATIEYRREKLSLDIGTDIAPVGLNRLQQELHPDLTARRPPADAYAGIAAAECPVAPANRNAAHRTY